MKYVVVLLLASVLLVVAEMSDRTKIDGQYLHYSSPQSSELFLRNELLDSTGNGYTLWTNLHESISFNPFHDYLMVVNRAFSPSSFLNAHLAPGDFSFWDHVPYIYQLEFGPARYPTAVVTNTHHYASFPALAAPYEANWIIMRIDTMFPLTVNLGNLYPQLLHKVITKELNNGNLLSIGVTLDTIYYKTITPNLDSVISEGVVTAGCAYWGYDINGGIANIFFHDTLIDTSIYYRTTIDGVNWSDETSWNLAFTPPYPSTKIIWTQMALTDDGQPRLVFDAIDNSDASYPWYGKVYVSHTSGVPPVELTAALPDTEAFYPTIACGGGKVVTIFNIPRNNLEDSLNWWDIHYCYSADNGITWSAPINLTESSTNRVGLQQIAKRIDTLRNRFLYIYVIDPVVNHDPFWHIRFEGGLNWMYIYFDYQSTMGVDEEGQNSRPLELDSPKLEFYPSPFRDRLHIKYSIGRRVRDLDLRIYNAMGLLVKHFSAEPSEIDRHVSVEVWDGTDNSGKKLPSGVYFLKFQAGDYSATEKLLLIR